MRTTTPAARAPLPLLVGVLTTFRSRLSTVVAGAVTATLTAGLLAVTVTLLAPLPAAVADETGAGTSSDPSDPSDPSGGAEEGEAVTPAEVPAEPTPLTVTLTSMTPSSLPQRGPIRLSGTVRNDSAETWSAINVYPFLSHQPMTRRAELLDAVASPESAYVGDRMAGPAQYAVIGDLDPGEEAPFAIRIRRNDLAISGAPGVYWIGVHALGQNAEGRDDRADGRARTFIPMVPKGEHTSAALIIPLREPTRYAANGRVADPSRWTASLQSGRLHHLLDLVRSAQAHPLSLLIDPAVLDVAEALATGNQPVPLGAAPSEMIDAPTSRATPRVDPSQRSTADAWLDLARELGRAGTVLGLGYGDPDVSALARRGPLLLDRSYAAARAAFERHSITALPAAAPPSGWLADAVVAQAPQDTVLITSDHGAPRLRSIWQTQHGQTFLIASSGAAAGGPGPGPPNDALAVRQRILAEAALRVDGSRGPMIVNLPADWDPGPAWAESDFFDELQTGWLRLTDLPTQPGATTPLFDAGLPYPDSEQDDDISGSNIRTAQRIVDTADVLDELLVGPSPAGERFVDIAMESVSHHARTTQETSRVRAQGVERHLERLLERVHLEGTEFVTLSGGTGTLTVTLLNQLDQPIIAGVRATTDDGTVTITDASPQRLEPGQRAVMRLQASASNVGIRDVAVRPVTQDGSPVGSSFVFSLRSSQVGRLIWGILAGSLGLLVIMIGRRIHRGISKNRWRGQ